MNRAPKRAENREKRLQPLTTVGWPKRERVFFC